MSLLVWLPLNGNLNNQGIGNITITNNGATVNNNGKIGSCYNFSDGTTGTQSKGIILNTNFTDIGPNRSICAWIKPHGSHLHYTGAIASSGNWNTVNGRWAFGIKQDNSGFTGFDESYSSYYSTSIPVNEWTHLCVTVENGITKFYKNGVYLGQASRGSGSLTSNASTTMVGRETYASGYFSFNGDINDFRIYDHCLSTKEVKEISKGLVLHYKLDDISIQQMNNCYNYPTFNTSSSAGGWSHWTNTGGSGSYGQTTDKNFIYNKANTYAHYSTCNSSATYNYLLYQSPAFDGGIRSLQAIIKESQGRPITEDICYPAWNARNGGVPNNKWTSIIGLGDGFYLCKCEGISQDGSNDLVGIYTKPGYTIYVSEAYLENDREICSNIESVYGTGGIVYDCSGYCNDGTTTTATSPTISTDSPRYDNSYVFGGSKLISTTHSGSHILTMSIWAHDGGTTPSNGLMFKDHLGDMALGIQSGYLYSGKSGGGGAGSTAISNISYTPGVWHHWVMVKRDSTYYVYLDGRQVLSGTSGSWSAGTVTNALHIGGRSGSSPWPGRLSDFRAYATALSVDDILELYQTSSMVDNKQNIFSYEFVEDGSKELIGEIKPDGYPSATAIRDEEGLHLTGKAYFRSFMDDSAYIPINPTGHTYYYDIEYSNNEGNQFYIGFEKFDANKQSGSNQECNYQVATKAAKNHARVKGTINLTTANNNPAAFTRLRILNQWTGTTSGVSGTPTIHHISLREVTNINTLEVRKNGQDFCNEFLEYPNAEMRKNGITTANNLIEI